MSSLNCTVCNYCDLLCTKGVLSMTMWCNIMPGRDVTHKLRQKWSYWVVFVLTNTVEHSKWFVWKVLWVPHLLNSSLSTTSNMYCQLLRQKSRQKLSAHEDKKIVVSRKVFFLHLNSRFVLKTTEMHMFSLPSTNCRPGSIKNSKNLLQLGPF